jgi:hypothetical protein
MVMAEEMFPVTKIAADCGIELTMSRGATSRRWQGPT